MRTLLTSETRSHGKCNSAQTTTDEIQAHGGKIRMNKGAPKIPLRVIAKKHLKKERGKQERKEEISGR